MIPVPATHRVNPKILRARRLGPGSAAAATPARPRRLRLSPRGALVAAARPPPTAAGLLPFVEPTCACVRRQTKENSAECSTNAGHGYSIGGGRQLSARLPQNRKQLQLYEKVMVRGASISDWYNERHHTPLEKMTIIHTAAEGVDGSCCLELIDALTHSWTTL